MNSINEHCHILSYNVLTMCRWLLPYLQVLQKWIVKTGLVGGRFTCCIPDYFIPYLFINFCFEHCSGSIFGVPKAVERANDLMCKVLKSDFKSGYVYGPLETWESIIKQHTEGEVKLGKNVQSALMYFFDARKHRLHPLELPIHSELQEIFPGISKMSDMLTKTTRQLLESEMERGHHRLALHIDAMALLSNLQTEKVFYVETQTANAVVGNEPHFKAYLRNKSGAYTELHPRTDHR